MITFYPYNLTNSYKLDGLMMLGSGLINVYSNGDPSLVVESSGKGETRVKL